MNIVMVPKLSKVLALTVPFLAGLILFPRAAVADVPVLDLIGTNNSINMGGVYTSPYRITVDGVPSWLVCDDFVTDINIGNKWYADVYTLPQVGPDGPQKFHGTTPTIQDDYYAAAWLAYQLLTDSSIRTDTTTSAYYSYAIWEIFEPAAENALTSIPQGYVTSDMGAAYAATSSVSDVSERNFLASVMKIYTPVNLKADGYIYPSQEFFGVPEASTVAFLAFDLLALAGIVFLMRRRTRRDA
jgi:hypothetical protein